MNRKHFYIIAGIFILVTYIFVSKVSNTHDRALFDGILLLLVVDAESANLEAACHQLVNHFRTVNRHWFHFECAADNCERSSVRLFEKVASVVS